MQFALPHVAIWVCRVGAAAGAIGHRRWPLLILSVATRPRWRSSGLGSTSAGVALLLAACQTTTAAVERPTWYSYPPGISREGKIHLDFGDRYAHSIWQGRRHQGIDIRGHCRQPIHAIADGQVVLKDHDSCAGLLLVIDHGHDPDGESLIAHYLHLGGYLVDSGRHVKRGDLIAWLDEPRAGPSAGPASTCTCSCRILSGGRTPCFATRRRTRTSSGSTGLTVRHASTRKGTTEGTITYPLLCDWQVFTVDDVLEPMEGQIDEAASTAH